jgi:hypothetical protein
MVKENVVSYFPSRAYDSIDELAEAIMNPANCRSSTVKHPIKTILNLLAQKPYTFTQILSNQI